MSGNCECGHEIEFHVQCLECECSEFVDDEDDFANYNDDEDEDYLVAEGFLDNSDEEPTN